MSSNILYPFFLKINFHQLQVLAWGDNDHGQQGTGTTTVNKKPCSVIGLDTFVNRVACGSSHSVAWSLPQCSSEENKREPVPFSSSKDPLGSNGLGIYDSEKTQVSCNELEIYSYLSHQIAIVKDCQPNYMHHRNHFIRFFWYFNVGNLWQSSDFRN